MFLAFVLLILFCANVWGAWLLGSGAGVVGFLVSIPVFAFILIGGAVALGLVNMLVSKQYHHSHAKKFVTGFFRGWLWLLCVVWFLPWGIFGTLLATNAWAPATLPRITLSNGDKTLIFQSMMHVASPGFYTDIGEDMKKLTGQEYVFFYEGVRPGTDESLERLSALLGTDVSPEMYDTLGMMAGLVAQRPEEFASLLPSMNVDISTDDIVRIAQDQNIGTPDKLSEDLLKKIERAYPQMNSSQKYVCYVLSRAVMNMILRVYERPEIITQLQSQVPVFSVILGERNTHIIRSIEASPSKHIYIHYGALHYPGILAGLQKDDPRWREVARQEFVVIR